MFKPNEIEAFSMLLDEPMRALEMRIMEDIVRRIKINGEITRSADWQIERLSQLGMAREDIRNALKDALSLDDKEVTEMYRNVIESGYARDRALYEAVGASFIPFEENVALQQLISVVAVQTNETLHNITQSLGFAVRQPNGKLKFTELAEYYQQTLDNAMLDIASGAFDYNTVLKRTVKEMTNSGLRTVDYATGWKNRVDVAARRAVMTGMSQLTAKVNEDNAQELGTDMFEVTWHSGARPEHQVWQGRWYTRKQLETVCGLGTVTGLCGANCYHDYYPVIPDVSEPTYTDEELAELNAKENTPVDYNGKQYTKYEALQRQRRLETTMRAQRQEIKLLKEGGASEDDLINARARYRGTSHEYAKFSQAMGIPQQRERVTVDGLGNIGQGKYIGGSGKKSPLQVPPVGAKVSDRVTDQERSELLSSGRTEPDNNVHGIKGKKKAFVSSVNMDCVSGSKPITEQLQKELSSEYDNFTETFGKLDNVRVVTAVPYQNNGVWGAYNDNSNELFLFGIGGENGKNVMIKTAKSSRKIGDWSTDSPYHAYRHELGHAWQNKQKRNDPLYSQKIKKIEELRKDINEQLTNTLKSDIIKLRKEMLSEYGLNPKYDIDEFISECIAEYCNGNPRKTAKSVVEVLLSKEL